MKFVAFGDWGMPGMIRHNVLTILHRIRKDISFCILLGDNFYPDGIQTMDHPRWRTDVMESFPPGLPLYAVLGNHDYHSDPLVQVMYTCQLSNLTWKMPFLYYDRVIDSVHFFFLDTALMAPVFTEYLFDLCGVPKDSKTRFQNMTQKMHDKQLVWLTDRLSTSRSRWKIVCGHYPVVSNGPHILSHEMQTLLLPLLREYGADVYLSGHDHNAQVIQDGSLHCIISGCTSQPPHQGQKKMPGTLFWSTVPGMFQLDVEEQHLNISYLSIQDPKPLFVLTLRR